MLVSILIAIALIIILPLALLTVLQLYSMYRTHRMDDILYAPVQPTYWPTQKWKTAAPEEQGVSSAKLLEMVDFYQQKQQENEEVMIDSITIIRNEHIIADLYFNPLFPSDKKHIINSCTKSIVGTLIGIALDKGYIKSVDLPVLELFKDFDTTNASEELQTLTVKDLLAMRTGWHSQDSYLYQWTGLFKMQATDDWVDHILKLPFEAPPNTRFDYSNMASFLLSAVITKASGTDTLSFANQYLFAPLGINDVLWDKSPQGIYMGFARMWLKPHDMAKIGLLYLQKGQWENEQLVSPAWVEDSIKAHSFPKRYRYIYDKNNKIDFARSGGNWVFSNLIRPFTDGYGYQWWLDKSGLFSAIGVGGQYIMVMPGERLIVAATSKLKGKDSFLPVTLLKKFIIPAIQSDAPLPANESVHQRLSAHSTPPALQDATPSAVNPPEMAGVISGNTYAVDSSVEANPWQQDNFTLVFEANADYAAFSHTTAKGEMIKYEVGLDNEYRITDFNGKSYAAIGEWTAPSTFTIRYEVIGYSAKGQWSLTFKNDEVEIEERGMTGEYRYQGRVVLLMKNIS